MSVDPRVAATQVVLSVLEQGRSLNDALCDSSTPLQRELVYGVLRWYWRLREVAEGMLDSPLRKKNADLMVLILVGLYQLQFLRIPVHASINETVQSCEYLGKPWAKALVNAILRGYARRKDELDEGHSEEAKYCHPQWMLQRVRESWPEHWQKILRANNQHPPMVLRINRRQISRLQYLESLSREGFPGRADPLSMDGVILQKPAPVYELPGFAEGHFVVQDSAAQWAARVLPVAAGDRVLDACAAPGGKLTHLLDVHPQAGEIVAIDIDRTRADLIDENLLRLGFEATVLVANAAEPEAWWDGAPFNCVVVDAPCSGTGIIQRRPDIKHLRRPADLPALVDQQAVLLRRLWQTLIDGGYMLYVTCSILEEENDGQIGRFVAKQEDVEVCGIELPTGLARGYGMQTLPGVHNVDGFYYSLMRKVESRTVSG